MLIFQQYFLVLIKFKMINLLIFYLFDLIINSFYLNYIYLYH